MKRTISNLIFIFSIACSSTFLFAQTLPRPKTNILHPTTVSWSAINTELTQELTQKNLGTLAQQERQSPAPKTAAAWWRRLALFVRADYPEEALKHLRSRPRFMSQSIAWGVQTLVEESGRYENLALARRLCELFPEQTHPQGWFERWLQQTPPEVADRWLAARKDSSDNLWFHLRLKLRGKLGTERELLISLENAIKKRPDQFALIETYLRAVEATEKPYDISWVASVAKPKLAVETRVLASYLRGMRNVNTEKNLSISLFERVLEMPFTPKDAQWYAEYIYRMRFSYFGSNYQLTEKQLKSWVKRDLLDLYRETHQSAKAQRLLEQISAEEKGGIPDQFLAYNAGQIQGQSRARVIEKRIEEAIPEQKETPEYWLSRGLYYSGRKEDKQTVEAFEKGLSLAPMPLKGTLTMRWRIVQEYARHLWLRNIENPTDAYAFVHKELDKAPLDSDYALALIATLLSYDQMDASRLLLPSDERLWEFLAAQSDWEGHGQLLLKKFLRNAPDQAEAIWNRAEQMAQTAPDPQRSRALATLSDYERDYPRATRWIEHEIKQLTDSFALDAVYYNLWRNYRQLSDWRGMERLLAKRVKNLDSEFPAVTAPYDLAIACAESGEKERAANYFRIWANQDRRMVPTQIHPLPSHGLIPEIREFYRKMAEQEPLSATPQRVFKQIGEK